MTTYSYVIEDITQAADLLLGAFNWSETPQGADYWIAVSNNLDDLVAATKRKPERKCWECGSALRELEGG